MVATPSVCCILRKERRVIAPCSLFLRVRRCFFSSATSAAVFRTDKKIPAARPGFFIVPSDKPRMRDVGDPSSHFGLGPGRSSSVRSARSADPPARFGLSVVRADYHAARLSSLLTELLALLLVFFPLSCAIRFLP